MNGLLCSSFGWDPCYCPGNVLICVVFLHSISVRDAVGRDQPGLKALVGPHMWTNFRVHPIILTLLFGLHKIQSCYMEIFFFQKSDSGGLGLMVSDWPWGHHLIWKYFFSKIRRWGLGFMVSDWPWSQWVPAIRCTPCQIIVLCIILLDRCLSFMSWTIIWHRSRWSLWFELWWPFIHLISPTDLLWNG